MLVLPICLYLHIDNKFTLEGRMIIRRFHFSILIWIVFGTTLFVWGCKQEESAPPEIRLIFDTGFTNEGDTLEIGYPIRFRVDASGEDSKITNLTIKKHFDGTVKTVLDSGMQSTGFVKDFTFYQGIEESVEWRITVQDRNRKQASVAITIYKDPLSKFGGIIEYSHIRLGYQDNNLVGNFFLPTTGNIFFEDSASMNQSLTDVLVYFNFREDQGVIKPSPTFSSPGEEPNCSGELYTEYYPFLCNWSVRNYTKYDIRAINGVNDASYSNAYNDSLLIVSYDDVWGKKKYKWANPGLFIPFQTAAGKKGIIKVEQADTVTTGTIVFSMKIQI